MERKRNAVRHGPRDRLRSASPSAAAHHTVADRVAVTAATQWGVLRLRDLVGAGLSREGVRRWTDSGRLHRPYLGVDTLTPLTTLAPQGRDLAAVWGC